MKTRCFLVAMTTVDITVSPVTNIDVNSTVYAVLLSVVRGPGL